MLVDVLLVVGDDGFGNGLADSVDLRSVSTAGDANADVDVGCQVRQYLSFLSYAILSMRSVSSRAWSVRTELVNTEDQDGLVDLEAQDVGGDEGKRLSVDLNEALASLARSVSVPLSLRARSCGVWCVPCSGRQL